MTPGGLLRLVADAVAILLREANGKLRVLAGPGRCLSVARRSIPVPVFLSHLGDTLIEFGSCLMRVGA